MKAHAELKNLLKGKKIQAFVKGYELAYLNILDSIDKCYRNMKTD